MTGLTANEPVAVGAAVLGLAQAVVAVLVASGVLADPVLISAVQAFVVALVGLVAVVVRGRVSPVPVAERGW